MNNVTPLRRPMNLSPPRLLRRPGAAAMLATRRRLTPPQIPDHILALPPAVVAAGAAAAAAEDPLAVFLSMPQPNFDDQPDFNDNDATDITPLFVPRDHTDIIDGEAYTDGDILYRICGHVGSTDPSHYTVIRRCAQDHPTVARRFMIDTRRNPATREAVNFADQSRMRVVRFVAGA